MTITAQIAEPHAGVLQLRARTWWQRLWNKPSRLLGKLPERYADVDPEVLKRVPVPI
jgi:hypothetical protein